MINLGLSSFDEPTLSMASNTLIAPSSSTFFVRSGPPFPPAPALKYTTSAFVDLNASASSETDASSSERSKGDAPVAVISAVCSGFRMIEVTVVLGCAVRGRARRRDTYTYTSGVVRDDN